jgi:hypothetical protein
VTFSRSGDSHINLEAILAKNTPANKKLSEDQFSDWALVTSRVKALELANATSEPPDMTLERAKQYRDFLLGGDKAND